MSALGGVSRHIVGKRDPFFSRVCVCGSESVKDVIIVCIFFNVYALCASLNKPEKNQVLHGSVVVWRLKGAKIGRSQNYAVHRWD